MQTLRNVLPDGAVENAKREIDFTLQEGDEIAFTFGAETFSPVKYNTFSVGPFTIKSVVRPGESAKDAYVRIRTAAGVMFEAEFEFKKKDFFARLAEVEAESKAHK